MEIIQSYLRFTLKVMVSLLFFSFFSCHETEEEILPFNLVFQKPDSLCVLIDLALTQAELENSIVDQISKLECRNSPFCNFVGKVKLSDNEFTYLPYKVKIKLPNEPIQPGGPCLFFDRININIENNSLLLNEDTIALTELDSLLLNDSYYLFPLESPNKIRVNWSSNSNVNLRIEVYEIIVKHLNRIFNSFSEVKYGKLLTDLDSLELKQFKEDPRFINRQVFYLSFVKVPKSMK